MYQRCVIVNEVKPSSTEYCQTEALWYASIRQQHLIPSDPSVSVCSNLVMPAKYVRDLDVGLYIDCDMSMKTHVSGTVSSCFAALYGKYV